MYSNTRSDRFKDFKLFKKYDDKFLKQSFNKKLSEHYISSMIQRLKQEDIFFKYKIQQWKEIEEKERLFDDINDLIHREYSISLRDNKNQYFQQLFNNQTPLPAKKVQSVQFKDDIVILSYSVDQSIQQLSSQQNFDKMIYKQKNENYISQIDEEDDNVNIDLKLNNWMENYFKEGQPENVMPQVYKEIYFNLAISLAFFYKFLKNTE